MRGNRVEDHLTVILLNLYLTVFLYVDYIHRMTMAGLSEYIMIET